jgi:hypothetical protein
VIVDLGWVAGTEFVVGLGCSLVMLTVSAVQNRARKRQQPLQARAAEALAAWLAGGKEEPAAALRALPRSQQAEILMSLGSKLDGEAVSRLQQLAAQLGVTGYAQRSLASGRWWARLRAARYFSSLRVVPEGLHRLLQDANSLVRAEAVTIACASRQPEHVEQAALQLFDPPSLARFACQVNLPRAGAVAGQELAKLLANPPGDPLLALRVAGALREPAMTPGALACSHHEQPATRAAAAELLGQLGGPEAIARLQQMLSQDAAPEVQAAAAQALGTLNHWEVCGPLASMLQSPAWQVRYAAACALRKLGPPGELFLRKYADGEAEPSKTMAQFALQAPGLR